MLNRAWRNQVTKNYQFMKTAKVKFRFFLEGGRDRTMETTHLGTGFTKDDAEAKAWQAMASDNFTRNVILSTKKIEKISIEFLSVSW